MKATLFVYVTVFSLLLSACASTPYICPTPIPGTPRFIETPPGSLPTPVHANDSAQTQIGIGRQTILVDRVVEGPLCNDSWSGTVYVTCNVQVYEWLEQPTFLKDCNLIIEPSTVVYVAYHNNAAYYNGCSCHTGETSEP
jgi:hypothetical protein